MVKPKIYDEYEAQKAVNSAIDDTSIEDDFVDQYFEAALEVLTGKVQERSAASNHNLDLKKLEALLKLAKKKLDVQPSKENKSPKKSNESNNDEMENPTTSSSLTEKPKSPEKTRKPGRPPKRKNEEEEVQKKKEKKSKKSDNNVTVRKKRRKITEVLQEEAREQVFRGSKDPDSEALALALKVLPPTLSPVKTRSKTLSSVNSLKALTWKDQRDYSPTTTVSSSALVLYKKDDNNKKKDDLTETRINTRSKTNAPSTSEAQKPTTTSNKVIPLPDAPNKNVTNVNHDSVSATKSVRFHSKQILTNPRWHEFPTVMEEAIDQVLNSHTLKTGTQIEMRSGILDIILFGVTAVKASNDRKLGVGSVRKYCRDVKVLLESVLGNDVADEEFFENLEDRENITIAELKKAIKEYKKENIIDATTTNTEKLKEADLDKSKSLLKKRPPPIQANKAKGDYPQQQKRQRQDDSSIDTIIIPPPPNNVVAITPRRNSLPTLNNQQNKHQQGMPPINWGRTKPTAKTTNKQINNNQNQFDNCESSNGKSLMISFHNNSPMLLSGPNIERKPLKGTKEQLKKEIRDFLSEKYSGGSVDQFADILSTYISADSTIKKMMTNFDIPIELFRSGYILMSRFFKVEEAEVIDK
uniref:Uncharacterized protein n=2 Tax=Meloidogyne TaxID=189290 RepID=A0A914MDS6_MELIC